MKEMQSSSELKISEMILSQMRRFRSKDFVSNGEGGVEERFRDEDAIEQ